MSKLQEMFQPDFVLSTSLYASVLIGLFVPAVGVLLVLGQRSMLALALPQVGKFGVALTVLFSALSGSSVLEDESHAFFLLALAGSLTAMCCALLALWYWAWRADLPAEATTAAIYAIAAAGTLVVAASNIVPELGLLHILKGEILTVPAQTLRALAIGYAAMGAVLFCLAEPIHMVLYDQWLAYTSGLPARAISGVILCIVCVTIALSGLVSDPLAILAFLLLPPLTALQFVKHLRGLYLGAIVIGVFCAFTGFYVSYAFEDWNLPTSAAQIVLLGAVWLLSHPVVALRRRLAAAEPSLV